MSTLKKYLFPLIIFLILMIAVLHRSFNNSGFRYDAPRLAGKSIQGANIITEEQLLVPGNKYLIVNLDSLNTPGEEFYNCITLKVNPDSVLHKKYFKQIQRYRGSVILSSSENSKAARIWMLLSQKGLKQILILSRDKDIEVLKKEFRPDTTSVPEFI